MKKWSDLGKWWMEQVLGRVPAAAVTRPRRPHRSDSLTAQTILDALAAGVPMTVAQLERVVGTRTVQAALYALMRDGFVYRQRPGREYIYRLMPKEEHDAETLVAATPRA